MCLTDQPPVYKPTEKLDFELEVAYFVGGQKNAMGERISVKDAYKNVFGFVLMNDWSGE